MASQAAARSERSRVFPGSASTKRVTSYEPALGFMITVIGYVTVWRPLVSIHQSASWPVASSHSALMTFPEGVLHRCSAL